MTEPRARIAVLASGGGSNLQALLEYLDGLGDARAADVVLVVSNRASAGALERAARRNVPAVLLPAVEADADAGLLPLLREHEIDYVVLAGYLRLVPEDVVRAYHGRLVNVHPALLPAFGGKGMYGRRVHEAVLRSGVDVTGVTVHLVDHAYDTGRILAQWPVPVLAGEDAAQLASRVLRVEHALYPRVVHALAAGLLGAPSPPGAAADSDHTFMMHPGLPGLADSMNRALGHTDEY